MDKSWFPTVSEIYNPEPVSWVENECVWSKITFFRWLEVLEGTFIRTYMSQSCLGCRVEVFCVVGMQEMRIPTLTCRFYLFVGWGTCTYTGSKRVVFSVFGGLGGDFCKDIYEAKLFGMHIGSVLSGFDAGNVNTDAKISIVGLGDVYEQRGQK